MDGGASPPFGALTPSAEVKPIKPNFVRHSLDRSNDDEFDVPAHHSLVPTMTRLEYYTSPSVEAMSKMSEVKLSQIDNLEIGRYGVGSVRWPGLHGLRNQSCKGYPGGLTDVRRLDFDSIVTIDRGSITLYADRDVPRVGDELNKEAVVTLQVRPSRGDAKLKSAEMLKGRLTKISEEFGGSFISYDMDKWIFRLPHFNGLTGGGGKPAPAA